MNYSTRAIQEYLEKEVFFGEKCFVNLLYKEIKMKIDHEIWFQSINTKY